jgi:regulator of cell morphogenesis and NO signaling
MTITEKNNIGSLVANDYRLAAVFKKFNIDFCCNGNRTIGEASLKNNISSSLLIEELITQSETPAKSTIDYNSWPIDLLADYIEKKHHRYVTDKIPSIRTYLERISIVHGERHPELLQISTLFNETAGELSQHMKKEELILFPFIRNLVKAKESGQKLNRLPFGSVENPIQLINREHDAEGERFRKIAQLSDNYTVPADGCNTYKVSFSLLKEFEEDLHLHIHLESNILFPKTIEMEKTVA